jgi:hypothetical protein
MRRPIFYNKNLSNYCRKSTDESIKKISEKQNLERNKPKIKNPLDDNENGNGKPEFNLYEFLIFLSISTITIYFYKRLR